MLNSFCCIILCFDCTCCGIIIAQDDEDAESEQELQDTTISFDGEEDDEEPIMEDDLDPSLQRIIDRMCNPEHKKRLQDNLQSHYFIQQFININKLFSTAKKAVDAQNELLNKVKTYLPSKDRITLTAKTTLARRKAIMVRACLVAESNRRKFGISL